MTLAFYARVAQHGDSLVVVIPRGRRRGLKQGDTVCVVVSALTEAEHRALLLNATEAIVLSPEYAARSAGPLPSVLRDLD